MIQPGKTIDLEGMSVAERILLVQDIWDGIAAEQEAIELTEAQKEELDRRLAEHKKNPGDVISWEEIKAEVESKIQGSS